MAGGRDHPAILDIIMSLDTVLKTYVKSMATHTVWCGGFRWLKPVSMFVVRWRRADVVECLGLKPYRSFADERNSLMEGKMCVSRTLVAGNSNEMGL